MLSRSRRFVLDIARFVGMGLHVKVKNLQLQSPDKTAAEAGSASSAPLQAAQAGFEQPPVSKITPPKHNKDATKRDAMSSKSLALQQSAPRNPSEPTPFSLTRFDSLGSSPIKPTSPRDRSTKPHSAIRETLSSTSLASLARKNPRKPL
jgi:hypothetical protein